MSKAKGSIVLLATILIFDDGVRSLPAQSRQPEAADTSSSNTAQPGTYKVDSRNITLKPGQGIEIKYHMGKGAAMVYSWKATGTVIFEFHGVPDTIPANASPDYYESHVKDDAGKAEAHGTFISPSTGIHGWYWKNEGQRDVTIRLLTAGFFNSAKEFSNAGEKDLPVQDAR
jgi:hypothetical protein